MRVRISRHRPRAYLDQCVLALNTGTLTAIDAAKAKWWATELQNRVINRCLQLHGGYGYMREYPIARAYADHRTDPILRRRREELPQLPFRDQPLEPRIRRPLQRRHITRPHARPTD
nr:acyl-CoA dehydrogenase family protein [Streptomyces sp. ATCC 21386]